MLYVEKENGLGIELHVGVTIPLSLKEDIRSVYFVQADGHELDFIFQQFHGLPFAQGRVARWILTTLTKRTTIRTSNRFAATDDSA